MKQRNARPFKCPQCSSSLREVRPGWLSCTCGFYAREIIVRRIRHELQLIAKRQRAREVKEQQEAAALKRQRRRERQRERLLQDSLK